MERAVFHGYLDAAYAMTNDALSPEEQYFVAESSAIRQVASGDESCVILGRCADHVLYDDPNCFRIFIHARTDIRIKRIMATMDLTYEEALAIYYKTVEKSGGGMAGVRDEGGIRSTLDFVQDDLYYPEIADKAAYLMYSLCKGHYFADCNKRISITLTLSFFLRNGYMYLVKTFMEEMEAIGYHVAAGHIDRDLLTEVMRCIVNDEDYSESVKLELMEAMSQDIGFSDDE